MSKPQESPGKHRKEVIPEQGGNKMEITESRATENLSGRTSTSTAKTRMHVLTIRDEMGGDSSAEDEERLVNRKAGLKEGAELDDQETTDERRIRIAKSIIADAKALRKRTREEVMDDDNMDDFFQEDGEDDVQNMTQMLQNDIVNFM